MNNQNYSMTDVVNLASEVKELVSFQNSFAWHSESFTFDFQQEFLKVLSDKVDELEDFLKQIEFMADFKTQSSEKTMNIESRNDIQMASNH